MPEILSILTEISSHGKKKPTSSLHTELFIVPYSMKQLNTGWPLPDIPLTLSDCDTLNNVVIIYIYVMHN